MKKWIAMVPVAGLAMVLFTGIASAHIGVTPAEAIQGVYEKFTVRVPNEKEIPTVKVEVKFPVEDVNISRFEPKPGWKYEFVKDGTGKILSVVWTATGEGIQNNEFVDFGIQGKIGDKATAITWKAYQTYSDGTVVEWVGAQGSDKPASVTKVKVGAAGTDSHGAVTPTPASPTGVPANQGNAPSSNSSLYIAIAALLIGILAFVNSFKKRR
jgi:uncharacterized protein YcnI